MSALSTSAPSGAGRRVSLPRCRMVSRCPTATARWAAAALMTPVPPMNKTLRAVSPERVVTRGPRVLPRVVLGRGLVSGEDLIQPGQCCRVQVNVQGAQCGVELFLGCLLYTSPSPRD